MKKVLIFPGCTVSAGMGVVSSLKLRYGGAFLWVEDLIHSAGFILQKIGKNSGRFFYSRSVKINRQGKTHDKFGIVRVVAPGIVHHLAQGKT